MWRLLIGGCVVGALAFFGRPAALWAQQRSAPGSISPTPRLALRSPKAIPSEYVLTKHQGPYMILVATFLGPKAMENALKLARELRTDHGLEAYVYAWGAEDGKGGSLTKRRLGWLSQMDQVAVLAGSFASMDGPAQETLRRVKRLQPKCLSQEGPFPLRGAILIHNPLIPPARRESTKADPFLARINQGPYNIVNCKGKYTLQVAIWTGKVLIGADADKPVEPSDQLFEAAENAEELVRLLRKAGYEAYVFHGRQFSAVTVGSFDAPDDPRIASLMKELAGKKFGKHHLLRGPLLVYTPRIP
jgi:hypothetical protein